MALYNQLDVDKKCLDILTNVFHMQKQSRVADLFQGYQPNIESNFYNVIIFQVKVPCSDNT